MSVDAKNGLRTVHRFGISRQALASDGVTPILLPFPIIVAPSTVVINQNETIVDLEDINCNGEKIVAFSYLDAFKGEIDLDFSVGAPELDTFSHGRLLAAATEVSGNVFFEINATATSFPARTSGQIGYEVVAQPASATSEIYYIDPNSKLTVPLAIVANSPTGNEIVIGQHLAITISSDLATTGATIRGWVPCTFANATIVTSTLLDVVTVKAAGIDFNGKFAGLLVRNCSRLSGGNLGSDPKRTVKLRILGDPNDGTGLGYQWFYTSQQYVC